MAASPAMDDLGPRIENAAAAIRERLSVLAMPHLGLVLGSGLGAVVDLLDPEPRIRIPYADIPEVPVSSVPGHAVSWSPDWSTGSRCSSSPAGSTPTRDTATAN